MSLTTPHRSPFGPLQVRRVSGAAGRGASSGWAEAVELARAESLENRRCSRRVRYEARDALGVVLFSAGASTLLSVLAAVALSWAA
jgi:hypothetical protein